VTRDQALTEAINAASRAKEFADQARRDLTHPTAAHHVPKVAATSTAYADVARAYTDLAAVLPATEAAAS
jgi:hypothetical protein